MQKRRAAFFNLGSVAGPDSSVSTGRPGAETHLSQIEDLTA